MEVLVLSSELWPVFSGGLGVAVYELIKNMEKNHSNVNFKVGIPILKWSGDLKAEIIEAPAELNYSVYFHKGEPILDWESIKQIYGFNFSLARSCENKSFDIIHANDWMTIPAGVILQSKGKPLIFHIHSTEYDRTNNNPREWVIEMERFGAEKADLVVANSYRTKRQLVEFYGINPNKITVIYNGIDLEKFRGPINKELKKPGDKVVLFVGRLTIQKGVWHLLQAAKRVISKDPHVKFVIVGSGPDMPYLIKTAINLGIEKNMVFTGKVSDEELLAAYRMCDLFVMPSVNEPFGIVALEALASGKPVILSRTSGVCEVVKHCFKVDYWDTDLLASRILEIFHYVELKRALGKNGFNEVNKLSWKNIVNEFEQVYRRVKRA
ncbi:MAG: glycosyltransferase family 4 protein [Candidatus Altiarchaeota archaeon]|nr:glycosyltransferase family 4 protein [Candidatus Altiarchaeota archaeon]